MPGHKEPQYESWKHGVPLSKVREIHKDQQKEEYIFYLRLDHLVLQFRVVKDFVGKPDCKKDDNDGDYNKREGIEGGLDKQDAQGKGSAGVGYECGRHDHLSYGRIRQFRLDKHRVDDGKRSLRQGNPGNQGGRQVPSCQVIGEEKTPDKRSQERKGAY